MKNMHVEVKELPQSLQSALKKVGYNCKDVQVVAESQVYTGSAGSRGCRAFTMAVNIVTGATSQIAMGSWGGPNPFQTKPADDMDNVVNVPPDGAVIKGSEGGNRPTFATIYVNPEALISMLPGETDITDREKAILRMMSYKSFYKKELFANNGVTKDELNKLKDNGFIKINKAGATSLTAKGKSNRSMKNF